MRVALVGAECEESLPLRYIAGALRQDDHDVRLISFNRAEDTGRAARDLLDSGADIAGFSMVFTYRAREFACLAAHARQLGFAGHMTAGGHFAAFNAESLLRDVPAFDSIAIGEGESIMRALATSIRHLDEVRGLVWRTAGGEIRRNAPAVPQDLDLLPHPVRKQPADTYLGFPIANMLSSRGCTHACAFCSISAWHRLCGGPSLRLRSPERVAEEMAQLYLSGYRIFNFHDDNFFLTDRNAMIKRMGALDRRLRESGVGRIAFAAKCRPDTIDAELLAMMKEMGLFRLFMGIEAGTAEALKKLGRGQTRDDNERALDMVNALDIHACFNLLLLNPDSTLEDFRANVAFLRAHPHNPMNFCRTEIYAGTPLERRLRASGRLFGSYWGYGYNIADRRAQLVFELMRDAMWDRHHTDDNVQHLAMRVDYEYQLLAHFFGADAVLRRRVKQFIAAVNINSCDYLDNIADASAENFRSEADRNRYVAEMKVRIARDNERFTREALNILADIMSAVPASAENNLAGWTQRAASVGLAATLSLAAVREAIGQGHQEEERIAVPARVEPEPAKPAPDKPQQPPDGRLVDIRPYFQSNALRIIASMIEPAQGVEFELWLDNEGKVTYAAARKAGAKKEPDKEFGDNEKKKADKLITDLGAREYKTRENATQELIKMGAGVLPQIRAAAAKAQDPEVAERCKQVLDKLDATLNVPKIEEILRVLRAQVFRASTVRNKRFVIPVSQSEVENYSGGINTHIFEIAPMPIRGIE